MGLGLSKYYKNLKILKVFSPIKYVFDYFKYRVISEEVLIKFQFRKHYGKWPDIENPKMLSEKIQWLKLNERNSLITQCADKYKAREYVEEIIGSEYLVPLVFQTDNIEEFTEDVLPDYPFVVKSNHDTSGVYIFKDKSNLNFKKLKKDLAERLKKNLSIKFKEWSYKNIKPRVIVEKLLIDKENPNKAEIDDYKIHVFNGKVEFVEIMTGRGSGKVKEHCLDRNFNKQDFIFSFPNLKFQLANLLSGTK